jgi:hypothetical protein
MYEESGLKISSDRREVRGFHAKAKGCKKEHTVEDSETMGVENEEDVEAGETWCVCNLTGRKCGKW